VPAGLRFGLLVTEDDCAAETLELAGAPVAVMGATATAARSPLPVGTRARDFALQAVADGTSRAAVRYGIPAQSIRGEDWDSALVAWSRSSELDAIVTAYAPTGPVAERLARSRRALAGYGVELIQVRRRYDDYTWPHSTAGYFRLKSRIPELLAQLGLTVTGKPSRLASG